MVSISESDESAGRRAVAAVVAMPPALTDAILTGVRGSKIGTPIIRARDRVRENHGSDRDATLTEALQIRSKPHAM